MKKYWHQFKDSFVLIAHGITIQFTKINGEYGSEYQTTNKVNQRMIEACGEFQCGSIVVVEEDTDEDTEDLAGKEASSLIAGKPKSDRASDLIDSQESSDQGMEGIQDQTDTQADQVGMLEGSPKIEDGTYPQDSQESSDQGMALEQAISYMVDNYGMTRTISKKESVLAYASKMGVEIIIHS